MPRGAPQDSERSIQGEGPRLEDNGAPSRSTPAWARDSAAGAVPHITFSSDRHPLESQYSESSHHSDLEDEAGLSGIEVPSHAQPSPLLVRIGAALVDALVIAAIVALAATAGVIAFGADEFGKQLNRGFDYVLDGLLLRRHVAALLLAFGALVFTCYGTLCHTLFGATLGKHLAGLRVLTRDDTHPGFGESLGRTIASGVFLLLGGFGLAWLLVDPSRHSLHDRLAGTRVEWLPTAELEGESTDDVEEFSEGENDDGVDLGMSSS